MLTLIFLLFKALMCDIVVTIERGVVGFRFDNGDDDNMAEIVEWLD
jgi:hypothetical protein